MRLRISLTPPALGFRQTDWKAEYYPGQLPEHPGPLESPAVAQQTRLDLVPMH